MSNKSALDAALKNADPDVGILMGVNMFTNMAESQDIAPREFTGFGIPGFMPIQIMAYKTHPVFPTTALGADEFKVGRKT